MSNGADTLGAMDAEEIALFVLFQTTLQELVSPAFGMDVHHWRVEPPITAKPTLVSFPCAIMLLKKLAALALILKA